MKKIILFTFLLFVGMDVFSQAEEMPKNHWYFGVGGGFRTTSMNYSDLNEEMFPDDKNLNSAIFTFFGQYEFGKQNQFAVRSEIAYLKRGGELMGIGSKLYDYNSTGISDIYYRLQSNYFDIRVPLIYQFCKASSKFRPYAYIVPVFGFSTGGNIRFQQNMGTGHYYGYEMDLTKANMAGTYFAGSLGIGLKYQFAAGKNVYFLGLEANYEYGFSNTYSNMEKDGTAINVVQMPYTAYKIDGNRKFSGFEVKLTLGIPFSVFKKKSANPVVAPPQRVLEQSPVVVQSEKKNIVEEKKDTYTLQEINDLVAQGESVVGMTITAINVINFEFGKSTLKSDSYTYLDEVAEMLKRASVSVLIKGHTDNVGNEVFNQTLSEERALSVVNYLKKRGVDGTKLSYKGYGMSLPLKSNDTEDGRAMNRRVEFEILK